MLCPEKSIYCIVGASKLLGPRGYLGIELIVFTDPTLNIYPIS